MLQIRVPDQSFDVGIRKVTGEVSVGDDLLLTESASAVNLLAFAHRVALGTDNVEVVEKLALKVRVDQVTATEIVGDVEGRNTDTPNAVVGFIGASRNTPFRCLSCVFPLIPRQICRHSHSSLGEYHPRLGRCRSRGCVPLFVATSFCLDG